MFKVEIIEAIHVTHLRKFTSVHGKAMHKRSAKRAVELAQEAFDRDNKRQGWPCGSTTFRSVTIHKGNKEIFYNC